MVSTYTFYAFNTDCRVRIHDDHDMNEVIELFQQIESWHNIFDVFDKKSECSRFNQAENVFYASTRFYQALKQMMIYRKQTASYFEPFVEVLLSQLRLKGKIEDDEVKQYLDVRGNGELIFQDGNCIVKSHAAIQVNFHSFLKGYACDYMRVYLYERLGLRNFLIDFGGNILTEGMEAEGSYWYVGIQHPNRKESVVHTLSLTNASLVTSGSYERALLIDGVARSHLINPETGQFFNITPYSVSVESIQSVDAEVLSTALFVAPLEKYERLLQLFSAKAYVVTDADVQIYM